MKLLEQTVSIHLVLAFLKECEAFRCRRDEEMLDVGATNKSP